MNLLKCSRKLLGKWILIPFTNYYISKERTVIVSDIHLTVPPGVFHPTLFFSTELLVEFVKKEKVLNLKALELGAGSGLLSVVMAKYGALVTASDVNKLACNTVRRNAEANKVTVEVIHSDLFDNFNKRTFDLILINPPYYPKNPQTDAEKAWFCGDDFEYFRKLFTQLADFIEKNGYAVMVLSEDCNVEKISSLGTQNGYLWEQFSKKKRRGEWNYLFKISKLGSSK